MITDKAAFGLTVAERMAEEDRESQRMYAGPLHAKAAIQTEEEAVEYTAEIMETIGAERCVICGRFYLLADDGLLCGNCLSHMRKKLLVFFYFSYSELTISLWPSNRCSNHSKGKRQEWIRRCCRYLYERGRANHSIFQGGHAYEILLRA